MKTAFSSLVSFSISVILTGAWAPRADAAADSGKTPAAFTDTDVAAIRTASAAYTQAANRRDWSALVQLFTADALYGPPNTTARAGREAIENFAQTLPPFRDLVIAPLEIEGRGDLAYARGRWSYVALPPGQPPQPDVGKYLEIWRRQLDGTWQISRDIWNSDLPIAPAAAGATVASPAIPAAVTGDPWLGAWELNLAKSRLAAGSVPSRFDLRTFVATAEGEKATYSEIEPDGTPSYTECSYALDGRDYPVVGNEAQETLAFTRAGPRSLAVTNKAAGKVTATGTREVSSDGNVLTVTLNFAEASATATTTVLVFDRRATDATPEGVAAAVKAAVAKHWAAITRPDGADMTTVTAQHTGDMTIFAADWENLVALSSSLGIATLAQYNGTRTTGVLRDLHVQPLGNSSAVATFTLDGSIRWPDGRVDARPRRVTEVWVNTAGTWKEAHHHDSVFAALPAASGSVDGQVHAPAASPTTAADPLSEYKSAGVRSIPIHDGKYRVWTKRVGAGKIKLLTLHGGPGATHEYFECFEDFLPQAGVEFYYYDQLGSHYSDQPDDKSLWTIERFVEELEEVRAALGLEQFYLYGHSWGGMLGIEYALKHQQHLKGFVLSNMAASVPAYLTYVKRLRSQLPPETIAILDKYEARADYENPEYVDVLMRQVYARHLCRIDPMPDPVQRTFRHLATPVYTTLQGPNEFVVTGTFKDWDRWSDLSKIKVPTLVMGAKHDEMDVEDIKREGALLPRARVAICDNGSHMSMWDDQEAYFRFLLEFLRDVEAGRF